MATTSVDDDLRRLIDDRAARREVSARELTTLLLDRGRERQPVVHAVITPTPELALVSADRVDAARRDGRPLPLNGMPVVVKDNIDVAGVTSACGSALLRDRVAAEDAHVVRRLHEAGAVVLGKAHSSEFMASMFAHPDLPQCRNPWDTTRVAGASSTGSGAAVADDQTIAALGTDTGGSVRLPSAFCGITGLRPTHGLVSNTGVFPLAPTFDTVGPMARSAADVADLFLAMVGFDSADPRSIPYAPGRSLAADGRSTLRIGVPTAFFFDDCDPEIEALVRAAIDVLADIGHAVVEIDLPLAADAFEQFMRLNWAEGFAGHAERLEAHPDGYGSHTRDGLAVGGGLSGRDVVLAYQLMHVWRRQVTEAFSSVVDVIATPTSLCAPPIVEDVERGILPELHRFIGPMGPMNLADAPSLSLPCGLTRAGLPAGLQLSGPAHSEWRLLDLGRAYQAATDWHRRRPGDGVEGAATR